MIDFAPIDDNTLMNIDTEYYHSVYNGRLCPSQGDPGKKGKIYPFPHMWELFVYATILGITRDKRKVIEKPHKPFRWGNISRNHQKNLLVLAIAKFDSLDLIKDREALKRDIEEYANGGISIISQEIKNNPSAYDGTESLVYRVIEEVSNR